MVSVTASKRKCACSAACFLVPESILVILGCSASVHVFHVFHVSGRSVMDDAKKTFRLRGTSQEQISLTGESKALKAQQEFLVDSKVVPKKCCALVGSRVTT